MNKLFWILVLTALPSALCLAFASAVLVLLAISSLDEFVSLASADDPSFVAFAIAVLVSGPLGFFAIAQLTRIVIAVSEDGLDAIASRRGTVCRGVAAGVVPLLVHLSLAAPGFIQHGAIGIILSGVPILPLVFFIRFKTFRRTTASSFQSTSREQAFAEGAPGPWS